MTRIGEQALERKGKADDMKTDNLIGLRFVLVQLTARRCEEGEKNKERKDMNNLFGWE